MHRLREVSSQVKFVLNCDDFVLIDAKLIVCGPEVPAFSSTGAMEAERKL